MKLNEKIKTYNFWVSISSAIFLIVSLIGKKYNFVIDGGWFNDLVTSICSILVLFGIIAPPINLTGKNINIDYMLDDEIQDEFKEISNEILPKDCNEDNKNDISEKNKNNSDEDTEEFQNQK